MTNVLGALAWLVWLACMAWGVLTGPQNATGWWFNLGLFLLAPLVGFTAARGLDWKAERATQ